MASMTEARPGLKDTPLLKKARERFKLANEADDAQAQRERDDLAFYADEQWPADIKLARMGQQPTAGMPAVPSRPTLVINKVKEPVRQILNQERSSDIGIELVPADDFGDLGITPDDTEIQLREGLVRRIQRESIAADARTWAFNRAVIAGRGYYLVMTRYLPGKTWDQEIYVHRIYNQAAVLLDPAHEQPDGSDAEWGFIGTWMPWDRYTTEFGTLGDGSKNPLQSASEGDLMALTEDYPDWYQAEGEHKAVRVVDYWYVERSPRMLAILEDGSVAWKDELPEGAKPVDTRIVVERQIKYAKIGGGVQVLEETEWAGPDMPIVKVLGDELQPYDNQRRTVGMVRSARDAQMGYNYMVSKQVETIGLTPIPPLQVDPEGIDGYEPWYQVANTRTLPYLPYRTYDDEGRPLKEPHRPPVDPNILPIAQSIVLFDQSIKSTTAVPDPTLGNVDPSLKSGKAIREVVLNAQQSTSNFLDNLARSIRYEGQVINNLLYPIYGTKPGRLVRILTGEGESEMMRITDPEQQQAAAQDRQQAEKVGKLTEDAHFNVVVKVTRNFDSRRQQESTALGELIAAEPTLMTWFGDLYFQNSDVPNRKQLAERAKAMLAPPIQQMLQAKEQGQPQIPPQVQQMIAEMQERIQHAEAAMKELEEEARGKKVEAQTKLQIEAMAGQRDVALEEIRTRTELERARMDNATKIHVAEIAAKTKGVIQAQEMEHEAIALAHTTQHEAEQKQLDREALARQEMQAQVVTSVEGERQRQHESQEGEATRTAAAVENERNRQQATDTQ